jgi:mannosylglycerate hydrolase
VITLHLVSHTHWDREWYKPYQAFRLKLVRLIDGLLDLLARDPEYKYFMLDGQTIVLEDYLEIRPEREAELRRHIRAGRILIGPWHILPDEFLVSPEATIRNLLEGAQLCRRFGARMPVGYTPDPFGHIGQLPQILRGFGIEWAAFRRGLSDEPCEVWWQSPDGSRVLAAYLRDGYDNAAGLPTTDPALFAREVAARRDSLRTHSAVKDLLLMHGTDHMAPPPDTSAAVRSAAGHLQGDRLIHSTLPEYFAAVSAAVRNRKAALPVVEGEVRSPKRHHLLPGVLSTRMWIKQRNRECETLLERWAEPFSAYASLISGMRNAPAAAADPLVRNPSGALHSAWRLLMQNHPHDSICGCSIDEVHEEMKPRFAQAEQIGGEVVRASLAALSAAVDTRAGPHSLVVFNPAAGPRTDRVEAELHPPGDWDSFEITDATGTVVPHQAAAGAAAELINVVLDPASLRGIVGTLHEGRAGNLALRGIRFRREGDLLHVDAGMAEDASPDPDAWKRAVNGFREYLADPSIAKFHIRARNAAATRVVFIAGAVPGHGWKTFSLRKKSVPAPAAVSIHPVARAFMPLGLRLAQTAFGKFLIDRLTRSGGPPVIENEFLRVAAAADGALMLLDKRNGFAYHGLNRFLDGGDCGDSYNYCPPARDAVIGARRKAVRVRKAAAEQMLEMDLEMKVPAALSADRRSRGRDFATIPITTRITLYPGVPRADVHTIVANTAQDHRLRAHFPFGDGSSAGRPVARYDGHFEVVRRDAPPPADDSNWIERWRPEVPQREFTDLADEKRGLMIANRGLPEVEAAGGREIALTLMRCVGWLSRDDFPTRSGHAGPMLPLPGAQMRGEWAFDYAIIPHAGDWLAASREARAFAAPLRAAETDAHRGILAPEGSFVGVAPAAFEISSIKKTQDGRGILVRGWNTASEPIRVTVRPWRAFAHAERVNLAEERIAALRFGRERGVSFPAKRNEIISVIFR